jgi:hypothetical protein
MSVKKAQFYAGFNNVRITYQKCAPKKVSTKINNFGQTFIRVLCNKRLYEFLKSRSNGNFSYPFDPFQEKCA